VNDYVVIPLRGTCPAGPMTDATNDAVLPTSGMKTSKPLLPRHPNAPLVIDGFNSRDSL